jgi:uncharacterized protein YodC (DUF2158 family)
MDINIDNGDIVRLVAGGPVMKVVTSGVRSPSSGTMHGVLCKWVDKDLHYEWIYDRDMLELVTKERRRVFR